MFFLRLSGAVALQTLLSTSGCGEIKVDAKIEDRASRSFLIKIIQALCFSFALVSFIYAVATAPGGGIDLTGFQDTGQACI